MLAPGHFYGAIIKMDAQTYPFLTVPGVRRIRGEYISGGLLAPVYYNGLLEHADEVRRSSPIYGAEHHFVSNSNSSNASDHERVISRYHKDLTDSGPIRVR